MERHHSEGAPGEDHPELRGVELRRGRCAADRRSLYLSNRPIRARKAADAVRKHWGIENKQHYTRDVTLREDASRIRCNPGIFARLRSFAYNILRFNQSDTIAQDRYAAALGGL